MNDTQRLRDALDRGSLVRPTDAPTLVDLGQAFAIRCGADLGGEPPALLDAIPTADHVVLILADGLGMHLIDALPAETLLRRNLTATLHTVFPSSSAVALTSLLTGCWPAQHGVLGQWTHLPGVGPAALLQFIRRTGGQPLDRFGVTPSAAFPRPSLLRAIPRDTLALFPDWMVHSVSSRYFSGGRPRRGYTTFGDAIDQTIGRIATADGPTATYLYTPRVDTDAHIHGAHHPAVSGAVAEINAEAERLAATGARVIISADHGLLDTPMSRRHYLRPTQDVFDLLRSPPAGDARVSFFHVHDGARDAVHDWLTHRYGDRFVTVPVDDALALGLFGPHPVDPTIRDRFGDLLTLSLGSDVLDYVSAGGTDRLATILSHHSGLSPVEMRIPLIVA